VFSFEALILGNLTNNNVDTTDKLIIVNILLFLVSRFLNFTPIFIELILVFHWSLSAIFSTNYLQKFR
jgi:hypothetical protein